MELSYQLPKESLLITTVFLPSACVDLHHVGHVSDQRRSFVFFQNITPKEVPPSVNHSLIRKGRSMKKMLVTVAARNYVSYRIWTMSQGR